MATQPTIPARFRKLVSEHLGVPIEKITDEANLMDDLGADGLDLVELTMASEKLFDIEIPDDAMERLNIVSDWTQLIERKMRGRAPDGREYKGLRTDAGCIVTYFDPGSDLGHDLDPRFDLANKSPTGFEWGYEGSGPAQLALALCADALGDDNKAMKVYQLFKRRVIAPMDRSAPTWQLTAAAIRGIITELGS